MAYKPFSLLLKERNAGWEIIIHPRLGGRSAEIAAVEQYRTIVVDTNDVGLMESHDCLTEFVHIKERVTSVFAAANLGEPLLLIRKETVRYT